MFPLPQTQDSFGEDISLTYLRHRYEWKFGSRVGRGGGGVGGGQGL